MGCSIGGSCAGRQFCLGIVDGFCAQCRAVVHHALIPQRDLGWASKIRRMDWLKKLPGFQRAPHGLEWRLLRLMPKIFLIGTLLPAAVSIAGRLFLTADSAAELARAIQMIDILMIGLVIMIWTLALTVTIGCVIVWLMKGPAYVADGYDVSHSDTPKT